MIHDLLVVYALIGGLVTLLVVAFLTDDDDDDSLGGSMLRRTPLKRTKPMRRATASTFRQPRDRPAPTAYKTRDRQTDWMMAVKTMPCWAAAYGIETPCEGVIEADHAGSRGLSRKCADTETIPLCSLHHRQRTDFSGVFKTWDKAAMRQFLQLGIVDTKVRMTILYPQIVVALGGPAVLA